MHHLKMIWVLQLIKNRTARLLTVGDCDLPQVTCIIFHVTLAFNLSSHVCITCPIYVNSCNHLIHSHLNAKILWCLPKPIKEISRVQEQMFWKTVRYQHLVKPTENHSWFFYFTILYHSFLFLTTMSFQASSTSFKLKRSSFVFLLYCNMNPSSS